MSLKDPNVVSKSDPKRVAIVIANSTVSTTTQWPVGFWWSELSHPYYVLTEAGYEVEVFSPNGGRCEGDAMSDPRDPSGYSASDLISMGFIATPKLAELVTSTRKASEIDVMKFDAIIVAGGQSPMFTFDQATSLHKKFVEFYEKGKIAADNAVWSMNMLSRDKHVMPWRIQDEMKRIGANYVQAGLWRGFAIRDGNLLTGQQNFSGEETARLLLETLGH